MNTQFMPHRPTPLSPRLVPRRPESPAERLRAGAVSADAPAAGPTDEAPWLPVDAPRVLKGRGAVNSPPGRFERLDRHTFDDGWPRDDAQSPPPPTWVGREVERSILTRNQSPDIPFDLSINPYRGCEHGCIYCYARPLHSYVGLSPGLDWETRLFAKINAVELMQRELAARNYVPEVIHIGSATDCYQPIEREFRLTRGLLEVAEACGQPVTLTTKSSLVERDIDLLASLARRGLVTVFITLTTLDPALARVLEPRAAAPWRRLETIRRLGEAQVPVAVSVAPIIPFLNEPEIEQVLAEAAGAGARSAHYVVLRLPYELKDMFSQWLATHFPERAARIMARIRDMRGGRDNDPRFRSRMKGEGAWAELVRLRFDMAARRHGLARQTPELRTDRFVAPRPVQPPTASADGQLGLFADPPDQG